MCLCSLQYMQQQTPVLYNDFTTQDIICLVCQSVPISKLIWEQHINKILHDIGFHSTTHELCLYQTTLVHQKVLFFRQANDFAVACKTPAIAQKIITKIGSKLQAPLHDLWIVAKSNGINIQQAKGHLKISYQIYFDKVFDGHI